MKGIHPSWIPALAQSWDFVLVEADGSRRLPVKAPAVYEPVIPPGTDLVVGVIGLDALAVPWTARPFTGANCSAGLPAAPPELPSTGSTWSS